MRFRMSAAVAAMLMLTGQAGAQEQRLEDPAEAFGARESVSDVSLSPDGRTVVYLAPGADQATQIYAVDLATGETSLVASSSGEPLSFQTCDFSADDRLVCQLYGVLPAGNVLAGSVQLVAIGADGEDAISLGQPRSWYAAYGRQFDGEIIDWLPGENGDVLMSRVYVPEAGRAGTRFGQTDEGLGVDRVDTRSGRARSMEEPRTQISQYMTDARRNVRLSGSIRSRGATGQASDSINYHYRTVDDDTWRDLAGYNMLTRAGFYPLAIDVELNSVYGLKRHEGRIALFRISLDGSLREELVFAHELVDVDDVVRVGRAGRLIGVTFAEDRRMVHYFDVEYGALAQALSRAIPDLPLIRFVGASDDESILLLWAGSDSDPGRYYTFAKATRALNEIMLARPRLENVSLAAVRPVSYAAADGTMIPGYLTMPPGREEARGLPAIVMPHGGPSARDEWGFDWLAQYFAHQGYAVLQPNFRGSAGYGEDWFVVNGFQGWQTAIGDVSAGGHWLVREGIADPGKLGIVGWSYGGYAALQAGVVAPDLSKAIVAIAPVTDLGRLRDDARAYTNAANVREFIGEGPHIRAGSPAQNADRITAPVLLVHGGKDINVDLGHSELMRNRLQAAGGDVELITFPVLDHQLGATNARAQLLYRSDAFLRQAFGMPPLPDAGRASMDLDTSPARAPGPVFPGAEVPEGAVGAGDEEGGGN